MNEPTYEPVWVNGYENAEQRQYHVYHEKARAKAKFAQNCADRLMEHRPSEWPAIKSKFDLMDQIEIMLKSPRRFGTFVTKAEVRAVAFCHALHRAQKKST